MSAAANVALRPRALTAASILLNQLAHQNGTTSLKLGILCCSIADHAARLRSLITLGLAEATGSAEAQAGAATTRTTTTTGRTSVAGVSSCAVVAASGLSVCLRSLALGLAADPDCFTSTAEDDYNDNNYRRRNNERGDYSSQPRQMVGMGGGRDGAQPGSLSSLHQKFKNSWWKLGAQQPYQPEIDLEKLATSSGKMFFSDKTVLFNTVRVAYVSSPLLLQVMRAQS